MAGDLFSDVRFAPADRAAWLKLVEKTLGGKPFAEALIGRTDDLIPVEPIQPRSHTAPLLPRREPGAPWAIVQRIDDPDPARAAQQAREEIEQGATGLSLVFEGAPNAFGYGLPASEEALAAVLEHVPLNRINLRIDPHPSSRAMSDWLVSVLGRRRADASKLSLSLGIDPAAVFAGTGRLRMSIEALQASMPQSLAYFFTLGVPGVILEADGRVFHNAGATEAQELGIMLATAVGHLRLFQEARQALVYAAPHIGFALSVDQDQFLSMAKIRALRLLWRRVLEECAIPYAPSAIHAETSFRMMTAKDPETNVLRTTIAAFAAAVGGADSISILPHTVALGLPDAAARRLARNAQLIMADESHLDFVADPASGSGSVEDLTGRLCEAAWAAFQRIETEGGVLASLAAGKLQQRVVAAREARATVYAQRDRKLVGSTVFMPASERPVATLAAERRPLPSDGSVFCERLDAVRIEQTVGAAT